MPRLPTSVPAVPVDITRKFLILKYPTHMSLHYSFIDRLQSIYPSSDIEFLDCFTLQITFPRAVRFRSLYTFVYKNNIPDLLPIKTPQQLSLFNEVPVTTEPFDYNIDHFSVGCCKICQNYFNKTINSF